MVNEDIVWQLARIARRKLVLSLTARAEHNKWSYSSNVPWEIDRYCADIESDLEDLREVRDALKRCERRKRRELNRRKTPKLAVVVPVQGGYSLTDLQNSAVRDDRASSRSCFASQFACADRFVLSPRCLTATKGDG